MPQRDELVAEAGELLALYRQIGSETTTPSALAGIGVALGRALEELDLRET